MKELSSSQVSTVIADSHSVDDAILSRFSTRAYLNKPVEKAVLETINDYRAKNGLNKVIWCDKAYKAAYHHSYYLSDMKKIPKILHEETVDVENFDELVYFDDRLRKFVKPGSPYGVENIVTCDFDDWWFQRSSSSLKS